MRSVYVRLLVALSAATTILSAVRAGDPNRKTQNILFVTTDGLRWQEVFGGADEALMNRGRGGVQNLNQLRKEFWRETPEERRLALLPFTSAVIAKNGQLFGNRWKGSNARATNGCNFSYPGYSELFCGIADERIDSNEKKQNPNVNVLEWLHGKDAFKGRIAAFSSWDVIPFVLNAPRSGLPVNAGWQPLTGLALTPGLQMLNDLMVESPMFGEETRNDALTFRAAKEYLLAKKPRVLYVAFDQTDEQGHAGRYDRVLGCARKVDRFVQDLWETMQSLPDYRGTTSLIFTTDHGRGDPPMDWKNHGKRTAGSDAVWVGILGPDTAPLGERRNVPEIKHTQIAATLAALLGEDFCTAVPAAGKPIADAIGQGQSGRTFERPEMR
jgi:Type I phosphodiesterase / nucleotide pyrophosphatase